jgi:hypothetical protein
MVVQHPHKVAPGVVHPNPLPAEGSSAFSNLTLFGLIVAFPKFLQWTFPSLFNYSRVYWILLILTALPVLIAYWTFASTFGARRNEKVQLPGRPITHYLEFNDPELKKTYMGRKIPMQILYDNYFEGKIDFKGQYSSPACPSRCPEGRKGQGERANAPALEISSFLLPLS